jgi:hypothetical protein
MFGFLPATKKDAVNSRINPIKAARIAEAA